MTTILLWDQLHRISLIHRKGLPYLHQQHEPPPLDLRDSNHHDDIDVIKLDGH